MSDLKESFEDVADWCETNLEAKWGREIGMTFGTVLRYYGRLATLPAGLPEDQRVAREQDLTYHAENLLSIFSLRFYMEFEDRNKIATITDVNGYPANYTYDALPRPPKKEPTYTYDALPEPPKKEPE